MAEQEVTAGEETEEAVATGGVDDPMQLLCVRPGLFRIREYMYPFSFSMLISYA